MRLALLTALLAPLVTVAETPSVTVEPGTTITKTYRNLLELELVGIGIEVDGEEQEVPADGIPEVSILDDENIVFVDEYVSVDGGRATTLVRTYESLANDSSQTVTVPGGEETEEASEGASELEGRSVRFVWDEDAEEYDATFGDDEDGDVGLLEDLHGDADFLFLFPADEDVEVGDTWTLEGSVFSRISSPSGDLNIDDDDDDKEEGDHFSEQFEENLTGEIEATFVSLEDGVATISLEGSVSTDVEMEVDTPEGAPEGIEISQTFSFSFDLEGELLWDMERGSAASMTLGGDVELNIAMSQAFQGQEILQTQFFEGTFEASAEFE